MAQDQRLTFELLSTDASYTDVLLDEGSGGLKATHILHSFHPKYGHFEKEARDILFINGNRIILTKELAAEGEAIVLGQKYKDGVCNEKSCEICTIPGVGKNTIKKALQHCKSKDARIAILYFPDSRQYSEERFLNGLGLFNGNTSFRFEEILVLYDRMVHKKSRL